MYDAYEGDQYQQLEAMVQAGELQQALALLEDWHTREPWNSDVLIRLAVVHWLAGEPARTLRDLDAVLAMDPENAEVLARRAQALLMLGKREDAEATLAKAEALDPGTPGVLLNRALLHEDRQEYEQAIAELTEYLEQLPQDHLALARRSHLHRHLGHYAQALTDALAASEMRPEDPETYFAEALARVTLEQGQEALAACDRCLQLKADFHPALRLKIDLLADFQRLEEAQHLLEALDAAEPAAVQTTLLRARLASEHGRHDEALVLINAYLEDCPDEAYGYYRRGMIYYHMANYPLALADFQEYERLAPAAIEALEQQFMCFLELARFPQAAEAAEKAVALQPENYRLQYNAGFALLLCNAREPAADALLEALRLNPENEDLILRIHLALAEYAPLETRLAWFRRAAALHASPLLQGLLAESCLEYGEVEEALRLTMGVLEHDPQRSFGYLLGIKAFCQSDRYPEALALADAGVVALPRDGRLRLARALVLRDVTRYEDALEELTIARELLPDDPEVLRQRALVQGSMGQIDEAITLLEEVAQQDGNHPESLFWLGYFLLHRKRYRQALAVAERLLDGMPAMAEGRLIRGAALAGLHRRQEAEADITLASQSDPSLVVRVSADPVIANLITSSKKMRLSERVRRSMLHCWQLLVHVAANGG